MISIRNNRWVLVSVIALTTLKTQAQFTPSPWEVGLNAGTLIYQGDLSQGNFGYTNCFKPAAELWVSRSLDPYFSIRANLLQGSLYADESTYAGPAWRTHRNLKFSTPVTEVSAMLVWDLAGKTYREGMHRFSPYLFAGVGFALLNVHRDWSRFDTAYFNSNTPAGHGLGIDTLTKPPSFLPIIPVGVGLRYQVATQFFINLEATYRISSSDYIDGFSYAANPAKNDHYFGVSVGVSYRFGWKGISCPKPVL
jgi:hypothetical protein